MLYKLYAVMCEAFIVVVDCANPAGTQDALLLIDKIRTMSPEAGNYFHRYCLFVFIGIPHSQVQRIPYFDVNKNLQFQTRRQSGYFHLLRPRSNRKVLLAKTQNYSCSTQMSAAYSSKIKFHSRLQRLVLMKCGIDGYFHFLVFVFPYR